MNTNTTKNKPPTPLFALVDGKVTHMPGDSQKEAEDLLKLARWLCGEKPPRIQWPNATSKPE